MFADTMQILTHGKEELQKCCLPQLETCFQRVPNHVRCNTGKNTSQLTNWVIDAAVHDFSVLVSLNL